MRQARAISATALGILIALAGASVEAPAWAQGCSTVCSDYYDGECIAHTTTCPGSAPSASGAAARYGAIAYGATSKAWGYSYRWASEAKAENVAMQNCAPNGDDCKVAVWFKNQCGAVVSGTGTDVFWALGGNKKAAGNEAMKQCATGGDGADCELQIAYCSN